MSELPEENPSGRPHPSSLDRKRTSGPDTTQQFGQLGKDGFNLTVFLDPLSPVPFQSDTWVNFGTGRLNRIASDTSADSITVFVPNYLITAPGTVPVTVTNPGTAGNTGGSTGRVYFTVQ